MIFTAEEKGLRIAVFRGASDGVGQAIKADLNLDMFLPLFAFGSCMCRDWSNRRWRTMRGGWGRRIML